ncbi:CvpA family protein [Patescibacteria group bacterium]|nr:CvpA family protein [Patescibacteria group bacterium]MBU1705343.1 CvpA family protein [Patescibacteria group bacterium]
MVLIDIILLLIVAGFLFLGLAMGFASMVGSILGTIIGLLAASTFSPAVYDAYGHLLGGGSFAQIAVFVILFVLTSKIIGVVLWFLSKIFNIFAWIPLAGLFDRLLGGLLGLIESGIVIGGILYFATTHISPEILLPILESSAISKLLIATASAVSVFGPDTVDTARNTFNAAKDSIDNTEEIVNEVKNRIETGQELYETVTSSGDLQF